MWGSPRSKNEFVPTSSNYELVSFKPWEMPSNRASLGMQALSSWNINTLIKYMFHQTLYQTPNMIIYVFINILRKKCHPLAFWQNMKELISTSDNNLKEQERERRGGKWCKNGTKVVLYQKHFNIPICKERKKERNITVSINLWFLFLSTQIIFWKETQTSLDFMVWRGLWAWLFK